MPLLNNLVNICSKLPLFHEDENLLAVHHLYPLTGEVTVWQVPHSCKSNIEEVTYEAMTLGRPVLQVFAVRMDITVVIYEVITLQCRRSVQVLVVRMDIISTLTTITCICVVIYEAMMWEVSGSHFGCHSG